MEPLLILRLARRPLEFSAAKHMKMQMAYRLLSVLAAVADDAIASRKLKPFGGFGNHRENVADNRLVFRIYRVGVLDMGFGYYKKMHGSLRVDVIKRKHFVVLVDFVRRDFPRDNFAK